MYLYMYTYIYIYICIYIYIYMYLRPGASRACGRGAVELSGESRLRSAQVRSKAMRVSYPTLGAPPYWSL